MQTPLEQIQELNRLYFEKSKPLYEEKSAAVDRIIKIDFDDPEECKKILKYLFVSASSDINQGVGNCIQNSIDALEKNNQFSETLNQCKSIVEEFNFAAKIEQNIKDSSKVWIDDLKESTNNIIRPLVDSVETMPTDIDGVKKAIENLAYLREIESEKGDLLIAGLEIERFRTQSKMMVEKIMQLDAMEMAQSSQNTASALVQELLKGHPAAARKQPKP